jgi:diguanylate cyclase (GGDEF)-like protein/PAS domain S-box-containing protein
MTEHLAEHCQELLAHFLGRTRTAVAVLDREGTVTGANPALANLAGMPGDSFAGRRLEDIVAPSFREPFLEAIQEACLGARVEIRLSVLSLDGLLRPCALQIWPGEDSLLVLLEEECETDEEQAVTGAETPEAFQRHLSLELYRAARYHRPLAVVKCEVDGVEDLRAQYGDEVTGRLLAMIGWALRKHTRRTDVVARMSYSQFALLLPETDLIGAYVAAEKLSQTVRDVSVETALGHLHPTACFGVVAASDTGESTPQTLLEAADWVLSLARRGGPGGIEAAPSVAYRLAG